MGPTGGIGDMVGIADGYIVIRLAIANIPGAMGVSAEVGAVQEGVTVIDAAVFAQDVVSALQREDEEGTTMVHRLFDDAFNAAIDAGADGLHFAEEGDSDEGSEP